MEQQSLGFGTAYEDKTIKIVGQGIDGPKRIEIKLENGSEYRILIADDHIDVQSETNLNSSMFVMPRSGNQIWVFDGGLNR